MAILKHKMMCVSIDSERVVADNGYSYARYMVPATCPANLLSFYSLVKARDETVNHHLKHFNINHAVIHHDLKLYGFAFYVVVWLTAMMLDTSDPVHGIIQ